MVRHVSFHRQFIALLGFSFAHVVTSCVGRRRAVQGRGVGDAKGQLVRGGRGMFAESP